MSEWSVPATVVRVVDADTLLVDLELGWHVWLRSYVRLLAVDAPERGTPDGDAATAFVKGLVAPEDQVTVVSHRLLGQQDTHGRALASVILADDRDLSTVLLESGHAKPWEAKR